MIHQMLTRGATVGSRTGFARNGLPRIGLIRLGLACLLGLMMVNATSVLADSVDSDAKPACLTLGQFIKVADTASLKTFMGQASNHLLSDNDIGQTALLVDQHWDKTRVSEGPFFLAERNYTDNVHDAWYMVINGGTALYLHCAALRSQDHWQLETFEFNTEPDKIPLP